MGKVYTRFQTKRYKNPTLWGGTYLHGLYKEVPPPPRPGIVPIVLENTSPVKSSWIHPELSFHDISCLHLISSAKNFQNGLDDHNYFISG